MASNLCDKKLAFNFFKEGLKEVLGNLSFFSLGYTSPIDDSLPLVPVPLIMDMKIFDEE